MEHFYYSFVLTLLHSLWQAALLLCIYFLGTRFLFRLTPLQKRNTAYLLLLTQSLMSIGCFMVLFNHLGIGILLETLPKKLFSAATPQITEGLIEVSFFAYLGFFVSKLIRLGFSLGSIWSLSNIAGIRPHLELTVFTTQKAYHLGIRKKVSVWYSAHVKSALTYGVLKPVILLPISLVNQLSLRET